MTDPDARNHLAHASQRAGASLETAKDLLQAGYPSPALVWAVRSVEIFLKEFVLSARYTAEGVSWDRAFRKAGKLFDKLSWRNAFDEINEVFGPLDPMAGESGRDALDTWSAEVVPMRHNIVHGKAEATDHEADWAVAFAEQLILQLKLRLLVAGKHPFSEIFRHAYEAARLAHDDQGRRPD